MFTYVECIFAITSWKFTLFLILAPTTLDQTLWPGFIDEKMEAQQGKVIRPSGRGIYTCKVYSLGMVSEETDVSSGLLALRQFTSARSAPGQQPRGRLHGVGL